MFGILQLLLPGVTKILDKLIPDADKRAEAKEELTRAILSKQADVEKAVADAARAQAEINLKEAESPSLFVAGWRPFIGWVCGLGCAYAFILQPLLNALSAWMHWPLPPNLDSASMMGLLSGLLGLGGMRTYERIQGVDRQTLKTPIIR